ncbi:MAG: hypothetical protein ABL932_10420 [Terricaulis sp.]
MKPFLVSAALAASLLMSNASAAPFPSVVLSDLNGQNHTLASEWRGQGGIVIMGFAHDAREGMDRWVEALGLSETDTNWIQLPVIGDVNTIVRPMIRTGMRGRYASTARRAHVAPVFDGADALRGTSTSEIEVLVVADNGEVTASVSGEATPANIAAIRAAQRR